jgi:hypothetical protein
LELRALDVDEFSRKDLRALAALRAGKVPRFFHDLVFDRQTVTIPAGDKGAHENPPWFSISTTSSLRILLSAVPMWTIAVGKRRAVVQNEKLSSGARCLDLFVESGLLPLAAASPAPASPARLSSGNPFSEG